jgi:L,D-transpeptidase ErfK/SrfK
MTAAPLSASSRHRPRCPAALLVALSAFLLFPAGAARSQDITGELATYLADHSDTFNAIAQRFDLGYVELLAANPGVDSWLLGAGQEVLLPSAHLLPDAPREGIVINLADQRLYYFPPNGDAVRSFPIGLGRKGWETPTGETWIVRKRYKPTWVPPASIRAEKPHLPAAVPPGPANPLGDHALDLDWERYVIHGTNRPAGIGRRISHGCIRLYPDDVAWLFGEVPIGTKVRIVDQPAKLGRIGGDLYLEVHPSQSQADQIEKDKRFESEPIPELIWRIKRTAGEDVGRLDWAAVRRSVAERRGIPLRITR